MGDLILTTFDWVPEMPRGYVRDLRVRWALEEAGLPTGGTIRPPPQGYVRALRTPRDKELSGCMLDLDSAPNIDSQSDS